MRTFLSLTLMLMLAACDDMAETPRLDPYEAPIPPFGLTGSETVPEGALPLSDEAPVPGWQAGWSPERFGAEVYGIWCAPCHGADGGGAGPVARILSRPPPSLRGETVRNLPDAALLTVIRQGKGIMYGFDDRLTAGEEQVLMEHVRQLADPRE